jgi:isopentenyl diphosphate isomerase/L-lactate dehydrogenase-like FMN-dependent dehydrogenase
VNDITDDPNAAESEFYTLHEIVAKAQRKLPRDQWDYLVGATETETTMRRNRQALDTIALRPRVCRNVLDIDVSGSLLGQKLRIPVLLAPIGSLESFDPGGGATSGQAAEAFDIVHMLSSRCGPGLEETAAAADNKRIFQLYVRGDAAFEDDHVKRAIDNGYYAFAVTVDSAHYSRRERDLANRFAKPWRVSATGMEYQALYTWDNVKRFKDKHDIPLILKGIGTAEDAALCVEHGVDAVYVSNHGGRQLDHGLGTMAILPEVVKAVDGKATVIVDGGFYRGTDIVKAIAMGADAVGIGRLQGWGLAAGGKDGLVRVLQLLEEEMRIAMGLLGATSLGQLNGSCVQPALPVGESHVTSAFPLADLMKYRY